MQNILFLVFSDKEKNMKTGHQKNFGSVLKTGAVKKTISS